MPEHATAHVLPLQVTSLWQVWSFLQRTSHDVALQAIAPAHELSAPHATLQSLPLHPILPEHEPVPPQLIWHEVALVQSIGPLHELAPRQSTLHGMPGGQISGPSHALGEVQPRVQVPSRPHVPRPASAHSDGHDSAALLAASPSELPPSPGASASPPSAPAPAPVSAVAGAAAS